VRRLGAVGRLRVAADLDLEDLQRRAVVGLEEVVEDLRALRFNVVDELLRGEGGIEGGGEGSSSSSSSGSGSG